MWEVKQEAIEWPSFTEKHPSTRLMRVSHDEDLHGNVPDRSDAVLLIVDVINDLEFPDNEYLVEQSGRLAERIRELKKRCKALGIPTIYVNDNHGRWRSDIQEVVKQSQWADAPGRRLVHALSPDADDYVVLKPRHSAFFATPLELILEYLGARTIILAGITTNACVLISAGEVFLRGYRMIVPSDCVAALTPDAQGKALKLMEENFNAQMDPSAELDLTSLLRQKVA